MKRQLFLLLTCLSLLPLNLPAAEVPPPDKLLPADTLGVLTVTDYAKASKNWSQWPMSQLWEDPALKPFRAKFEARWKSDVLEPLQRELGIQFSEWSGFAQGQLTLALTANGWEGKPDQSPGFLFLLDARDKSGALKERLAKLKQSWTDRGKTVRTEKIRDLDFTVFIFSPDDLQKTLEKAFPQPPEEKEQGEEKEAGEKKPAKKLEWLVGVSDSLLIVGNSAKEIEKILVRQSGGSLPSLSEQPVFAAQYGPLFRDSLTYGWLNLKTMIDAFAKSESTPDKPGQNSLMDIKPSRIVSALGLGGLQSFAFNLRDTPEGQFAQFNISVPEGSRTGIFKILAFPARDSAPLSFVPADVIKFSRWRLDLQKAWTTLESSLVEMMPQVAGVMKLIIDNAGKDKDPNFDLRKSLIANLGDDLISYEKKPRKFEIAELQAPPSVFLLGSPRAEVLAGALKALASSLLPPQVSKMKEREFLGRKVNSISLPATAGPNGQPSGERQLSFVASGSYVALSTDVAALEEYLRNTNDKSLPDVAGLNEAAEKVGGMNTGLFGYENQREAWRSYVETLRQQSAPLANVLGSTRLAGRLGVDEKSSSMNEWLDFSLLPPFDQIAKYFHFAVWSGATTADGLQFKYFQPTPPGLKK